MCKTRYAKCLLHFGAWSVQTEGKERVTGTAIAIGDWWTEKTNSPLRDPSHTPQAGSPTQSSSSPACGVCDPSHTTQAASPTQSSSSPACGVGVPFRTLYVQGMPDTPPYPDTSTGSKAHNYRYAVIQRTADCILYQAFLPLRDRGSLICRRPVFLRTVELLGTLR
jgi:hypothetical protein